jgi:sugar lactone lactonase YvrE
VSYARAARGGEREAYGNRTRRKKRQGKRNALIKAARGWHKRCCFFGAKIRKLLHTHKGSKKNRRHLTKCRRMFFYGF